MTSFEVFKYLFMIGGIAFATGFIVRAFKD